MTTISEALTRAIQYHRSGYLEAAEQIYRQILHLDPKHAEALHLLGVAAHQTGRNAQAVEYIEQALALRPLEAGFHNNLGLAHQALHHLDRAVACYRQALALQPRFPEAYYNLGKALKEQGELNEAIACYRQTLVLKPDHADALNNLGNILKDQERLEEAVSCFRQALQWKPNSVEAHNNLGIALTNLKKPEEALVSLRQALVLNPQFAPAHYNLGNALFALDRLEEASASYRQALLLQPTFAEPHAGLGHVLVVQEKLEEAIAAFQEAVRLQPDNPEHHWCLATVYLLQGNFEQGWPAYEWRRRLKQAPRSFPQPLWDGSPLEGRTILLHAEQGLGDTLQFLRFAPLVKQCGGTVLVDCHKPLVALLEGFPGVDQLIPMGEKLPAFEVQAPLLSLPGIFRTSLATLPPPVPFASVRPEIVEQWRRELAAVSGFRVGIAWQGNPAHKADRRRSIPLTCFAPLARLPGIQLLSLQKGPGTEQLPTVADRFSVIDLGSRLEDFLDTAAVVMNLDLLITCDTAVAHLAGTLGIPTWVALTLPPDWRLAAAPHG